MFAAPRLSGALKQAEVEARFFRKKQNKKHSSPYLHHHHLSFWFFLNLNGTAARLQVVLSGRGRGKWAGPMGRGRPPAVRASPRVGEGEGERRTVCIEGLSSSTTDVQLKNLLRSMGPIEVGAFESSLLFFY